MGNNSRKLAAAERREVKYKEGMYKRGQIRGRICIVTEREEKARK